MYKQPQQNSEVPSNKPDQNGNFHQIKARVHKELVKTLDLNEARQMPMEQLHAECANRVNNLLGQQKFPLSGPERRQLVHEVMSEIFGLGPLDEFTADPLVSDILVNGPDQVYIERGGRLEITDASFKDNEHLMRIIHRIATNVGRRIDDSTPMLDARLADGSRVNAIIPPLALDGPALSIRRFGTNAMDIPRLIDTQAIAEEMAFFLQSCVQCRMNMLISGGTGSGKTTLLNALSRWIPGSERIVTIEDAAELRLQQEHVIRLETRPPNIEGKGEVTQRALLRNSLRMRPDRIIIGEVRGDETIDMLQAMNTGHEGSMTTVHANSPRDALRRLENMVSMAGINYPVRAMREQISSALDVLVHVARLTGGSRKVVKVVEIAGMEGDAICLHDIFQYNQRGVDDDGNAFGQFEACGVRPRLLERLRKQGAEIPQDMFHRRALRSNTSAQQEDVSPGK